MARSAGSFRPCRYEAIKNLVTHVRGFCAIKVAIRLDNQGFDVPIEAWGETLDLALFEEFAKLPIGSNEPGVAELTEADLERAAEIAIDLAVEEGTFFLPV